MSSENLPIIRVPFPPNITVPECINIPRGGRIPTRPPNCFIIYRRAFQKALHESGYKFQINKVSALASESWQRESVQVKKYYKVLSGKANRHLIHLREKENIQNKNKALLTPPIVPSQPLHGAFMLSHSAIWSSGQVSIQTNEANNLQHVPRTSWNNYSNNYTASPAPHPSIPSPESLLDTTYSPQGSNFPMFFDQNEQQRQQQKLLGRSGSNLPQSSFGTAWNESQINLIEQQSINQSSSSSAVQYSMAPHPPLMGQIYTPELIEYVPLEQESLESPTVEDEFPNSNRF